MEIDGYDEDGAGLCEVDGRAVAVAGTIAGERVEIAMVPGATRARLLRVLRPSAARLVPRCRHAGTCGGCTWQHLAYPAQLQAKRERLQAVADAVAGRGAVRVGETRGLAAADVSGPWGYRHKVHFAFADHDGTPAMGHLAAGTRRVLACAECPVHAARGNDVAFAVRAAVARAGVPAGEPPRGVVRHVVARVARSSGEVVATLVVADNVPALRRVSRTVLDEAAPDGWHLHVNARPGPMVFAGSTRHLHGRARVREEVGGIGFLVSPTAFFQTCVEAATLLSEAVLAAVPADAGRVLDLYAGLGFFALPLARRGHRVVAVEESAAAVEDGEVTARANRLAGACRFVRARVEEAMARLARDREAFGAVVLDPPREGASAAVLGRLRADVGPARIVYVSCFPEALRRDLPVLLSAAGEGTAYRLASITPIDMFPHTAHVEAVAVLDRADRRQ